MINQTELMGYRLANLDIQQQRVSYQMSTNESLQNGSDDSVLFARTVYVDDKIRGYEGIKSQIQKTAVQNNAADSSIEEVKKILEYVKEELIKANTSTTTDDGKVSIGISIASLKENLYQLANTQVEGEYIFSGSDSSVKPFEKDASTGKVSYVGSRELKKVLVEEGSYKQKGITGLDMMFYPSSTAYKGETLNFKETDVIIDQDGNEWKMNSPTNDTLVKYDSSGNATSDTIAITGNDGLNPATYSATMPSTDGTKFEAKTNIFNFIDDTVNALNKVDSLGNPISDALSLSLISKSVDESSDAYDSVNESHAQLGGRNKVFEISLERVSAKLTQYDILSQEIGSADLTKVAMEAKALELTYTALYSTISKTNQLSLVNFIN